MRCSYGNYYNYLNTRSSHTANKVIFALMLQWRRKNPTPKIAYPSDAPSSEGIAELTASTGSQAPAASATTAAAVAARRKKAWCVRSLHTGKAPERSDPFQQPIRRAKQGADHEYVCILQRITSCCTAAGIASSVGRARGGREGAFRVTCVSGGSILPLLVRRDDDDGYVRKGCWLPLHTTPVGTKGFD